MDYILHGSADWAWSRTTYGNNSNNAVNFNNNGNPNNNNVNNTNNGVAPGSCFLDRKSFRWPPAMDMYYARPLGHRNK